MACVLMVAKNKIMTFVQAVGVVIEGMQKMTYMSIVLIAAFCLGNVCGSLGTAKFIVDITRGFLTPALLPFLYVCDRLYHCVCNRYLHGTFGILLPLAIPISMQFEINVYIGIAAVVSGALFGDHCSPSPIPRCCPLLQADAITLTTSVLSCLTLSSQPARRLLAS